ncbi:hypothetical protein [Hyphomicrobium sulfonivorans]|uniref:hypothetical protein n=1 Tax=Hyphomicrobium sulfonivorans TaxID=121290 RepID=UPI0018E17670|nr:hypothetical protein [Hyphomicrobium sulfonivorans]
MRIRLNMLLLDLSPPDQIKREIAHEFQRQTRSQLSHNPLAFCQLREAAASMRASVFVAAR